VRNKSWTGLNNVEEWLRMDWALTGNDRI